MNIEAFIDATVCAHNRSHPGIIISKSWIAGRAWYFLYAKDSNIWSIRELFLFRSLYEKLSPEGIFPCLLLREIDGEPKIGIAIEVYGSL